MPTLAENKQARFDYELLENFEAGLKLSGQEVKSARSGQMKLSGAFVRVVGGEAWLLNAHIPKYAAASVGVVDYDPTRTRKLLLSSKELKKLADAQMTKGLTIVPVSVYTAGKFIKIKIAIARGKKQFEKRESIKKRDVEREMRSAMKR